VIDSARPFNLRSVYSPTVVVVAGEMETADEVEVRSKRGVQRRLERSESSISPTTDRQQSATRRFDHRRST